MGQEQSGPLSALVILTLRRQQYLADCTLGCLDVCGRRFFTIERPWEPHPKGLAGAEFKSCVPEGEYRLMQWTRPSGEKAFSLSNPKLDVYQAPYDIPRERHGVARCLILIHAADYVHDVMGGIGPGLERQRDDHGWVVTSSREAMNQIRTLVAHKFDLTLIIAGDRQAQAA